MSTLLPDSALSVPVDSPSVPDAEGFIPGRYMAQAIEGLADQVAAIQSRSTYGIYAGGAALVGGYFREGESASWRVELAEGVGYAVVGAGDEDARDVVLRVYYPGDSLLAEDLTPDATPSVVFQVPVEGVYRFELQLAGAARGSFCALAILERGAFEVPTESLRQVTARFVSQDAMAGLMTQGMYYHEGDRGWALFGASLDSGATTNIWRLDLDVKDHVIQAVGDDAVQDVDLSLYDGLLAGQEVRA